MKEKKARLNGEKSEKIELRIPFHPEEFNYYFTSGSSQHNNKPRNASSFGSLLPRPKPATISFLFHPRKEKNYKSKSFLISFASESFFFFFFLPLLRINQSARKAVVLC